MKVMWVTNVPLAEGARLAGLGSVPFAGWLDSAAEMLADMSGMELTSVSPTKQKAPPEPVTGALATHQWADSSGRDALELIRAARPDVVHIHGTEGQHSLPFAEACAALGVPAVVSVQGVLGLIADHLCLGIPSRYAGPITPRSVVRGDSVVGLQRRFRREGARERAVLASAGHAIGRTTWDRAWVASGAPGCIYHHCDESLRSAFYGPQWDLGACERNTLFISQGHYPVKGLHFALLALAQIRESYPDVRLRVGGRRPAVRGLGLASATGYEVYLRHILHRYELWESVEFLGPLNERQMVDQLLRTHVFVSPSTIENSSNSLAEAMVLGMPTVGSYVGGMPDMVTHAVDGFLYQADAPYMLAHYVNLLLGRDDLCTAVGTRARDRGLRRHDRAGNRDRLLTIYEQIIRQGART